MVTSELTRADALRILELGPDADLSAVKRAYRRLARERHPDAGGDAATFHELQLAFDRLVGSVQNSRRPITRSSRPRRADWAESPTRLFSDELADLGSVDWDRAIPSTPTFRADRDLLAVLLARDEAAGPVAPVTARSRGPRSPLNRFIHYLDPDLTATWTIGPARSRGHHGHDVELRLRAWSRAARRRVDASPPLGWTAQRGSSSTTLVRTMHPSLERRVTAVRAVRAMDELLTAIDWPLSTWFVVVP